MSVMIHPFNYLDVVKLASKKLFHFLSFFSVLTSKGSHLEIANKLISLKNIQRPFS